MWLLSVDLYRTSAVESTTQPDGPGYATPCDGSDHELDGANAASASRDTDNDVFSTHSSDSESSDRDVPSQILPKALQVRFRRPVVESDPEDAIGGLPMAIDVREAPRRAVNISTHPQVIPALPIHVQLGPSQSTLHLNASQQPQLIEGSPSHLLAADASNGAALGLETDPGGSDTSIMLRTSRSGRKVGRISLDVCDCGAQVSTEEIESESEVMKCKATGCETVWVCMSNIVS